MYSKQMNFSPDQSLMRFSKKREEYQSRLVSRRPPEATFEERPASKTVKGDPDLLLIGALILAVMESDGPRDTVLLGILIYLMLG